MEAYKGLLIIQNKMLPMTLQTGLLSYENMVLVDVSVPNNKNNRLMLTLTFEEAIIVGAGNQGTNAQVKLTTTTTETDYITAGVTLASLGIGIGLIALNK